MKSQCRICKAPVKARHDLCDDCHMIAMNSRRVDQSLLSNPWILATLFVGALAFFGVLCALA